MSNRDTWLLIGAGIGLAVLGGAGLSLMGNLYASQIAQFAAAAGFSGQDLITIVSIALAESGGDPHAKGDIDNPVSGAASYGLWQVNSYYHPEFGPDFTTLYDPQTNANAAYSIYANAGHQFTPWTTYPNVYRKYVAQVQAAIGA